MLVPGLNPTPPQPPASTYSWIGPLRIGHLGPLQGRPILVVVGRSNPLKRSAPIDAIAAGMHVHGFTVCWYERRGAQNARLRAQTLSDAERAWLADPQRRHPVLGRIARKAVRLHAKLCHPKRRQWLGHRLDTDPLPTADELGAFIARLGSRWVFLLGHSAGGLVATQAESAPSVRGTVCFGYPFKHPDRREEPHRTAHLPHLAKPCLIIQGRRDAYGRPDEVTRYRLSPAIQLHAIDADHDYEDLTDGQVEALVQRLRAFMG